MKEPVLKDGSVGLLAGAVLALIVQLGVPISNELAEAIVSVVVLVAPMIVALFNARSKVTPVDGGPHQPHETQADPESETSHPEHRGSTSP